MRFIAKWTAITIGLVVLSIAGFIAAAMLTPGDPGRAYGYAALTMAAVALAYRIVTAHKSSGL